MIDSIIPTIKLKVKPETALLIFERAGFSSFLAECTLVRDHESDNADEHHEIAKLDGFENFYLIIRDSDGLNKDKNHLALPLTNNQG